MGTNFYFMSRDKDLIQTHFAKQHSWGVSDEEYSIVDEPYLGYKIHLNKLSIGWRPLFQNHKVFQTFNQLKEFYFSIKTNLMFMTNMEINIHGTNIMTECIVIV